MWTFELGIVSLLIDCTIQPLVKLQYISSLQDYTDCTFYQEGTLEIIH